jgi:hypothetical protein
MPFQPAHEEALTPPRIIPDGAGACTRLHDAPLHVRRRQGRNHPHVFLLAAPDGHRLHAAMRYPAPYADPSKFWPGNDIEAASRADLLPLPAD